MRMRLRLEPRLPSYKVPATEKAFEARCIHYACIPGNI